MMKSSVFLRAGIDPALDPLHCRLVERFSEQWHPTSLLCRCAQVFTTQLVDQETVGGITGHDQLLAVCAHHGIAPNQLRVAVAGIEIQVARR